MINGEGAEIFTCRHAGCSRQYIAWYSSEFVMLDWNHTKLPNWNERVATMCKGVQYTQNGHGNNSLKGGVDKRFEKRCGLPTPESVVKQKGRRKNETH